MLGDRQELDMGEAHVGRITRQRFGELMIAQPAPPFARRRRQDPKCTS